MNELIDIADRIHNTTSSILIKYNNGVELSEEEEEFLSEIFVIREEGKLDSLDDIAITENKFLKTLLMPRGIPKSGKRNMNNNLNCTNMKFDFNCEITGIDGKAIQISPTESLTVKKALKYAILNCDTDKKTGAEKFEIYNLAIKIEKEEELTIEELKICKDSVGKLYHPEVVGFVWSLLEKK